MRISKDYEERRVEFLDTTRKLVFTRGFKKMSVQLLTDTVGVAKGTFYHYFKSKEDLLAQWVVFEASKNLPAHESIVEDSTLDALAKLNKIFSYGRDWKLENMDMIMSAAQIMYDEDNLELRHKMLQESSKIMEHVLRKIIVQGVEEGQFNTRYPNQMALYLPQLLNVYTEKLTRLLIGEFGNGKEIIDMAEQQIELMHDTIERILGASAGSILLVDKEYIVSFLTRAFEQRKTLT